MDLMKSKTLENLAKAFANECQAGARYQFLAHRAEQQKLWQLKEVIKTIAANEMAHATQYYNLITDNGARKIDNININASYPYKSSKSIADELKFAAENENNEAIDIYPHFADVADKEGFPDIALKFRQVAEVEKCHEALSKQLSDLLSKGTMYCKPAPIKWKCDVCGYEEILPKAWTVCPLCNAQQGEVQIPLQMGK